MEDEENSNELTPRIHFILGIIFCGASLLILMLLPAITVFKVVAYIFTIIGWGNIVLGLIKEKHNEKHGK